MRLCNEGYTGWAKFEFDGNTYVYGNTYTGGTGIEGDLLIEFVGGANLNGDNVAALIPA